MKNNNIQLVYCNQSFEPLTNSMLLAEKFSRDHKQILRISREVLQDYGQ